MMFDEGMESEVASDRLLRLRLTCGNEHRRKEAVNGKNRDQEDRANACHGGPLSSPMIAPMNPHLPH